MFNKRKRTVKKIHFELIPMIDVMMILVLFLAIMAFLPQLQGGLNTELPSGGASSELSAEDLVITINNSGVIYVGERSVTFSSLVDAVEEQLKNNEKRSVVIAADKSLSYEQVIKVLNALQVAHIENVALATERQPETEEKE